MVLGADFEEDQNYLVERLEHNLDLIFKCLLKKLVHVGRRTKVAVCRTMSSM